MFNESLPTHTCGFTSQCQDSADTVVQYSTVQYSTVQYSTVQYSTVQYSTVQYSTVHNETNSHNVPGISKIYELDKTMTYTYMT